MSLLEFQDSPTCLSEEHRVAVRGVDGDRSFPQSPKSIAEI